MNSRNCTAESASQDDNSNTNPEPVPGPDAEAHRQLSCVSCRSRKLKCDRVQPVCARCARVGTDCVYPESRRKPAFKRRNVKELEARLAQVEVLLKEAGGGKRVEEEKADETIDLSSGDFDFNFAPESEHVFFEGLDITNPAHIDDETPFSFAQSNPYSAQNGPSDQQQTSSTFFGGALLNLGISESLPPFEVMEDLNKIFFERQRHFTPILHPPRYLQSFYSPPHHAIIPKHGSRIPLFQTHWIEYLLILDCDSMKPPMCLQYAIWAIASNGHEKYGPYHDVFYHRARQYAEADEMKGCGEHFLTLAHCQAWCCISTDEAKSMLFTRSGMSAARAVRLAQMMCLHRLDCPPEEISPTLPPPTSWAELEERRRAFWSAFCLDSLCGIWTGWPHLVDPSEITTHLPAPEGAFYRGQAVETSTLDEAFRGSDFSSFAGAILVCYVFNRILKHAHRGNPDDNAENYEYGEFWKRHRDIDNMLSSAFMFLPQAFRLPENRNNPSAIHINLNFHAAIICLHHAAIDKIDTHSLSSDIKRTCENRLSMAAQEIVNIVKLTSHVNSQPVVRDVEINGISHLVRIPKLDKPPSGLSSENKIPLLARLRISKHSALQPSLPGRLALGKPKGHSSAQGLESCSIGFVYEIDDLQPRSTAGPVPQGRSEDESSRNKRKRTSPAGSLPSAPLGSSDGAFWTPGGMSNQSVSSSSDPSPAEFTAGTAAAATIGGINQQNGYGNSLPSMP